MKGKLEGIRNGNVVGWLWDESEPNLCVPFALIVNGSKIGDFQAATLRQDLRRKGIGEGAHSFSIPLQSKWLRKAENLLWLSTTQAYTANPELLKFDGDNPLTVSSFERVPLTDDHKAMVSNGDGNTPVALKAQHTTRYQIHTPLLPTTFLTPVERPIQRPHNSLDLDNSQYIELLKEIVQASGASGTIIANLTEQLFRKKSFKEIIALCEAAGPLIYNSYKANNHLGRSLLGLNQVDKAIEALQRVQEIDPSRHGAIFYLGTAYSRVQRYEDAFRIFEECIVAKHDEAKYHLEAGRTAIQLAFGGYGVANHRPEFIETAQVRLERANELDSKDFRASRELATLELHKGSLDDAIFWAREATKRNPKAVPAWQVLSQTLARNGQYEEAAQATKAALDLAPNSDWAKFGLRVLSRFKGSAASDNIEATSRIPSSVKSLDQLKDYLKSESAHWVYRDNLDALAANQAARDYGFSWAAGFIAPIHGSSSSLVWRADFLRRLLDTGSFDRLSLKDFLERAKTHGAISADQAFINAPSVKTKPVALLISQFGVHKFGGAEQFLEQMAHIYQQLGYEAVLIGTRDEYVGESGVRDGIRYSFVSNDPDELFAFAVQENASVVHVVSGLGFEAAVAMRHLNACLIFGVHFWRELFYNPTPSLGYYPDVDHSRTPRPEFKIILEDFAGIYANSLYTQQVVENAFNVRTPVIYSLPDNWVSRGTGPDQRRGVLLANARFDKGFGLLLDVATRLPEIPFYAIASQSGRQAAKLEVEARKLKNVEILSRVSDMRSLYEKIRVAAVPSFRFVETFSRVVIEAHRLGVPVIGSDRGNVPFLLKQTGIALPEDPDIWADEIRKLCEDDRHWMSMSDLALENSAHYSFEQQQKRLANLIDGAKEPVLIAIGSGLGNVIHTTPLIRNLSRRLGRRVDIVIAGDYADVLFAVSNSQYVNQVFLLGDPVVKRRYSKVFITHSFGYLSPNFSSREIYNSRDWDSFRADHNLHEAEFNLAAAEALLGIPYEPTDISSYFLGELKYVAPPRELIGIHAGSKGGIWATKRWPHFEKFVAGLLSQGRAVASFGTQDEYVPGTIDMTGGTIEEMANRMLQCSSFVSNDSGVMNVANALGIPLVALFGPTNTSTRGPLAGTSVSIAVNKDCSPCEMHETEAETRFRSGACRCIEEISVAAVLEALESVTTGRARVQPAPSY